MMTEQQAKQRAIAYAAHVAAPVFAENGWEWGEPHQLHVPTEAELALGLASLVEVFLRRETHKVGSGRFVVFDADDLTHPGFSVALVLEDLTWLVDTEGRAVLSGTPGPAV
jgi:hypothetical protein